MTTTKRHYEVLYVIDTTLSDEQIDSIIAKYSNVITSNDGEVIAAGRWDRRRLAYEIKGRREGIYILTYFLGETDLCKELDRVMRIADDVFRHIIIRTEPEHIDTSRLERVAVQTVSEPKQEEAPAEAPVEVPVEAPAQEASPEPVEAPAAAETVTEASAEQAGEEPQAQVAE